MLPAKEVMNILLDEINNILKNGATRYNIKLRENTPKALIDVGIKDLPMLMNSSHVIENILTEEEARKKGLKISEKSHYYGLGVDLFIRAIKSLDNPAAILRWNFNKHNKYGNKEYIVLTSLLDNDNQRIIIPLFIETKGNYLDVSAKSINLIDTNKVKTIYGRNKVFSYFDSYIKDGSLELIKINKRATSDAVIKGHGISNNSSINNSIH